MPKKVTTHDISNSLGISRNTVSKALNNHPSISEATRKKVVERAIAMGYKKIAANPFDRERPASSRTAGSVAFLTRMVVSTEGYWMNLMSGVEEVLRAHGYDMKLSFIKDEDIRSQALPPMLGGRIAGFIVAGSLDRAYTEQLMSLAAPKVFVDLHADLPLTDLKADLVLMESEESVHRIATHLIDAGHREIGFIGSIKSRSLFERWTGLRRAMYESGIPLQPEYCLLDAGPHKFQAYEEVAAALARLKRLPTALVCANDLTALHAIRYARDSGRSVPDDIAIAGFDRIKETELLDISLTTVHNNEFQLGLRAADQLLYRMKRPDRPHEVIRLSTRVLFGESTRIVRA